jgi:hypothetical protein
MVGSVRARMALVVARSNSSLSRGNCTRRPSQPLIDEGAAMDMDGRQTWTGVRHEEDLVFEQSCQCANVPMLILANGWDKLSGAPAHQIL